MPSHTLKLSIAAIAALLALSACDKADKKAADTSAATPAPAAAAPAAATPAPATAAATPAATPAPTLAADRKAMKEACAAEIQKFCAGDAEKPGKCLKQHESELSPSCSTAWMTLKEARKAAKEAKEE